MQTPPNSWKGIDVLALLTVAAGTFLCLFPPAGNGFFAWWESFAYEWMWVLLATGLLFFIVNQFRLMMISFSGCALLCFILMDRTDCRLQPFEHDQDAFTITTGLFRVSPDGPPADTLLNAIQGTGADIVALLDVPPPALPGIQARMTKMGYSYFRIEPDRRRHLELIIYSRFPLTRLQRLEEGKMTGLVERLRPPGADTLGEFLFICTTLPESPDEAETTNELNLLAYRLGKTNLPVLALGHFDWMPWSFPIQSFKNRSALRDSRQGVRPASNLGHLTLFDRPTEYIFYSNHLKCVRFETISSGSGADAGIVGTYQFVSKEPDSDVRQTSQEL